MLIASYSAEPLARASATLACQPAFVAERRPERLAINAATATIATTPSKIHSHRYEVPVPLAAGVCAGAAEASGLGEEAGGTAAALVAWAVWAGLVGLGLRVFGENVGGETDGESWFWPGDKLATAPERLPPPCAHPAARNPAKTMASASTGAFGCQFIPGPSVVPLRTWGTRPVALGAGRDA